MWFIMAVDIADFSCYFVPDGNEICLNPNSGGITQQPRGILTAYILQDGTTHAVNSSPPPSPLVLPPETMTGIAHEQV
jgi:hypothetical protein